MLEGLKNVSPTFCKMTKAILKDQMYINVFSYVDDIVVASKRKATQIDNLAETFTNMRGAQLKLNLEKCIFGVQRGKVLRCLVSIKGFEANLDKFNTIVHMRPLQSKKKVQRLTDRIVALTRFISKLAERSLPFFIVLRAPAMTIEGQNSKQPMPSSLQIDQLLILYVSASSKKDKLQKRTRKYHTKSPYILFSKPLPVQRNTTQ
jgi:hypothetical protein